MPPGVTIMQRGLSDALAQKDTAAMSRNCDKAIVMDSREVLRCTAAQSYGISRKENLNAHGQPAHNLPHVADNIEEAVEPRRQERAVFETLEAK